MNAFVSAPIKTPSQAGTVIWGLCRLCLEDAMEILLLAGNGYGVGAQKLLRGMYERAVTARYLSLNPSKADDFVEFGKASRYKMVEPIRRTVGKKLIPKDVAAALKSSRDAFARRNQPRTVGARLRLWVYQLLGSRPRVPGRWSGEVSFEEMARTVGSLGRLVVWGWYLPSEQMHASIHNLLARTEENPEGALVFDGEAQRDRGDEALNWCHLVLLDLLALAAGQFDLPGLADRLEGLNRDYLAIWHGEERKGSESQADDAS